MPMGSKKNLRNFFKFISVEERVQKGSKNPSEKKINKNATYGNHMPSEFSRK